MKVSLDPSGAAEEALEALVALFPPEAEWSPGAQTVERTFRP